MTAKRVLLLRHGVTEWNDAGRFQGHTDIPLSAAGREMARTAGRALVHYHPTRLLSSDLMRARETAELVAESVHLDVETDARLREVDVGSWAGLDLDTVGRLEPDFWPALREGRDFRRSPEGESATEAGRRVADAVREYAEASGDDDTLLVVGHGLTVQVASLLLLGLDYSYARLFGGMANCAWNVLTPGPEQWRLRAYNHVADDPLRKGGIA